MTLILFELSGHRYALSLDSTIECLRMLAFAPLPKAPAIVEGVIDLRGLPVPIFDVRARFGHPSRTPHPSEHLLVARAGPRIVALRVDRVLGISEVPAKDIAGAASITPRAEYLVGVARLPDGIAMLHDLETFLDDAESRALDGALEAADLAGAAAQGLRA